MMSSFRDAFGGAGWGVYGNVFEHRRYLDKMPNRRRRCRCGCGQAATHVGKCNGIAMTQPGCELSIRRWVRDGPWRQRGEG